MFNNFQIIINSEYYEHKALISLPRGFGVLGFSIWNLVIYIYLFIYIFYIYFFHIYIYIYLFIY